MPLDDADVSEIVEPKPRMGKKKVNYQHESNVVQIEIGREPKVHSNVVDVEIV